MTFTPNDSPIHLASQTSSTVRVQVIDIGSVSVRMGIADVQDGIIATFTKKTRICNLAQGLDATGSLDPEAIERVLTTVDSYLSCYERNKCEGVTCTLTQAAREAANAELLLDALAARGLAPQVIDGELEGRLTALGAARACHESGPMIVADSGGGSTELCSLIALNAKDSPTGLPIGLYGWVLSTPLGCRRVAERFVNQVDPPLPAALEEARRWCLETLKTQLPESPWAFIQTLQKDPDGERFAPAFNRPPRLVVTGGASTTLAALALELEFYNPHLVQNLQLSKTQLEEWLERLAAMTMSERANLGSMDPARAPVIVSGTIILLALVEALGIDELIVSDADGLQGIALAAARELQGRTAPTDWPIRVVTPTTE